MHWDSGSGANAKAQERKNRSRTKISHNKQEENGVVSETLSWLNWQRSMVYYLEVYEGKEVIARVPWENDGATL